MKNTKRILILVISMIYCMTRAISYASPIVTNAWDVDFDNNAPIVLNVWRGDVRALTAQTGLTSLTNDAMFYWQSADMQSLWYETNATVAASGDVTAVWYSGMDAGDSYYTFFFRAGGVYCPRGTIRMQGSPGADPHALPLPVQHIDFDLIDVINPPWATPADISSAVGAVIEADPIAYPVATNALALAHGALPATKQIGKNIWDFTSGKISFSDVNEEYKISFSEYGINVVINAEFLNLNPFVGNSSLGKWLWPDTDTDSPLIKRDELESTTSDFATTNWVNAIRGIHSDIATNVMYHVVVSNGHWLIKEVK